jgi:SAM-dependent methyltransferase
MTVVLIVLSCVLVGSPVGAIVWLVARRVAIRREADALAAAGVTRFDRDADTAVSRAAKIAPRLCPICAASLERFDPVGAPGGAGERAEARCPNCKSLERHRLAWLYLVNETDLFTAYERKAVLHMCADRVLYNKLRMDGEPALLIDQAGYRVTDDAEGWVGLNHPTGTFDVVYCCYILEQIPDDRFAMRELRRVLKPSGWALIQAPVFRERTEELPAPPERAVGGSGRQRVYGDDFVERLTESGFNARVDAYVEHLGRERAMRHGLMAQESIYYCTRR